MKLEYIDIQPLSSKIIKENLDSNDLSKTCTTILSICRYNIYDNAIEICKTYYNHEYKYVRIAVLQGLVQIILTMEKTNPNFNREDRKFVKKVIKLALLDESKKVVSAASDTLDDLRRFIKGFSLKK